MKATIRVSADKVRDGVAVRSTEGEIKVEHVGDRVRLTCDATWKCDAFAMRPAEAFLLVEAIKQAAILAQETERDEQ